MKPMNPKPGMPDRQPRQPQSHQKATTNKPPPRHQEIHEEGSKTTKKQSAISNTNKKTTDQDSHHSVPIQIRLQYKIKVIRIYFKILKYYY
jgi:hypothetical protein